MRLKTHALNIWICDIFVECERENHTKLPTWRVLEQYMYSSSMIYFPNACLNVHTYFLLSLLVQKTISVWVQWQSHPWLTVVDIVQNDSACPDRKDSIAYKSGDKACLPVRPTFGHPGAAPNDSCSMCDGIIVNKRQLPAIRTSMLNDI